jgi:hypothetical protein
VPCLANRQPAPLPHRPRRRPRARPWRPAPVDSTHWACVSPVLLNKRRPRDPSAQSHPATQCSQLHTKNRYVFWRDFIFLKYHFSLDYPALHGNHSTDVLLRDKHVKKIKFAFAGVGLTRRHPAPGLILRASPLTACCAERDKSASLSSRNVGIRPRCHRVIPVCDLNSENGLQPPSLPSTKLWGR